MAKRIRPITSVPEQGVTFFSTSSMETKVRGILAEWPTPTVSVYPNWEAVTDNSRLFRQYCDASVDGFGATLEQEQDDHTIHPIVFISRAAIEPERYWTPRGLEAESIVWSITRLRGYLWDTNFRFFSDHKALKSLDKIAAHNPRIQR